MYSEKRKNLPYYLLLATVVLSILAFIPSAYFSIEFTKAIIISIGTILSAVLLGFTYLKDRRISLPPKSIFWSSIVICGITIISAIQGVHVGKSLFGQGFEIATTSFILILFLISLISYLVISEKPQRALSIYVALSGSFLLLFIFHTIRFILGAKYVTLSVLSTLTSTILGRWFDFSILAIVIGTIAILALNILAMEKKMKIMSYILVILSMVTAFVVNDSRIWIVSTITFIILTFIMSYLNRNLTDKRGFAGFMRKIAWLPLVIAVFSGIMFYTGSKLSSPVAGSIGANYSEVSLPWQVTLDIVSGSIKSSPLFGVGPNQFSKAYLAFKPAIINSTDAWNTEFSYGFGLIPTFIVMTGILGLVSWIIFFIFFGILGTRTVKRMPENPIKKFFILTSLTSSTFLWLGLILFVPSHAVLVMTFLMTGIFVAFAVEAGAVPFVISPQQGTRSYKIMPSFMILLIVVGVVWGLFYVKKTVAMTYFGSGVKQLTEKNDPEKADQKFAKAVALDDSDIYWQAMVEATLARARNIIVTANQTAQTASSSAETMDKVVALVNEALTYSRNAIKNDPTNYYNYLSEARVSEFATNLKMDNGYENALNAYNNAIARNTLNPSLYLNMAKLQASQNKLDDALRSVGMAIQIKNNYLDAIFLYSQITAAQGNLPEAIIAAEMAVKLQPENPQLYFQLGLLQYNNKSYSEAAKALGMAVKLQPEYANAKYFLGLSYYRLGMNTEAITQFEDLAVTNPGNSEINLILTNLKAGKSPFVNAEPPVTPTPEKRSSLPVKEKKK